MTKKTIIKIVMLTVLTLVLETFLPSTVFALQDRTYNFSKPMLTGIGATDMVQIAQSQNNRNQNEMGYTEAWCADFVSDCARIAGQSKAIQPNGVVTDMYEAVIRAGGYVVNTAQSGDLVFYKNTALNRWMHVGIMIDTNTAISGNYWMNNVSRVTTHECNQYWDEYENRCIPVFVRPNYSNIDNSKMTTPTIKTDKQVYKTDSTVHISWEKTSRDTDFYQYWLIVKNESTKKEVYGGDAGSTGNVDKNYYDIKLTDEGEYKITVYSVPHNDKETRQAVATSTIKVGDLGQMTTPTIRLDQKVYQPNNTIHITWDKTSVNTDFYQYWLIIRNSETKEEIYGGDAGSTGDVDKNYYDLTINKAGMYEITLYSVPYNDKETRQKSATALFAVGKCSHKYTSEVTTLATCAKTGIRTYTCSVCGDSYTETIAKITTHSYGSWTTTKTATCTEEGTETRTCSICGSTETRMIAKKTHVYTTKVIQSTYDAEGYTLHICSVCGDSYKDNYTAKLALMGDVTGDGKINTRDLNRLYAHVNGTNLLAGYEFDCGDVTGDGKINTRDLNRLYAHISETNLLW